MSRAEPARARPGLWIGLFLGSTGLISALKLTDAIDGTTGFILMAGAMGLLIPMARSSLARQRERGCASAAAIAYTRRMLAVTFAYVLGLGIAITIDRRFDLSGATAFLVALMPVVPIFGMIWAMARYLIEEPDEFLRYRATMASLVGLGAVLAIGSLWGFLETFGIVPHAPGWWAVPIWAVAMGLSQGWMAMGDRRGSGE